MVFPHAAHDFVVGALAGSLRRCSHSGIRLGPDQIPSTGGGLGVVTGIVAAGVNPAASATLVMSRSKRYADAIPSTSGTGG